MKNEKYVMQENQSYSPDIAERTEEERKDLENRMKILVDESNQVFNRFLMNFDAIHKKLTALFQIFLVLISIEIVVITYQFQTHPGFQFTKTSQFLFSWVFFWGFLSFILLAYLLYPKKYTDISIFEEKRFNELCKLDSQDLLSDFLYQMKTSYNQDISIYRRMIFFLYLAYMSILIMGLSYIILIIQMQLP
jgi:hypothetical protein